MFTWLKRLLSGLNQRKTRDEIQPYYPTEHADKSNALPLDPENDSWGRR